MYLNEIFASSSLSAFFFFPLLFFCTLLLFFAQNNPANVDGYTTTYPILIYVFKDL